MQSEGGVFISYASADRERVVPVVAELKDLGMRCWFDQQELRRFDAGLTERIGAGIAGTAVTLAFVSTAYQESVACRWELIRTVQTSGLPGLLLVRLEDCTAEWAIVKENVFCDLSRSSPAAVGAGLKDLHPPIEEHSPRGIPTQVGPEGWAGNAFEGRFDERLRLISWFTGHVGERHDQGHRSRRVQIVGLGGQGKTMLALQCATDLSNLYTGGILRLRAGGDQDSGEVANPASTLDGLLGQIHDWARDRALHLGVEVTLPERSDHNAWAQTRAVITPLVDKTLWLIDDLPAGLDGSELDRVLCPSPGDSLITTRSDAYKQYLPHTTLTLDAFSLEEAVYYLAYGSGETIDQDGAILEQIASEVGRYALALAVLRPRLESAPASEVLNNLRTAAVEELEDCAQDIGGLPAGHGASVVATLRMSVEALKRKQSVDILRLAAIWPRGTHMPHSLLKRVVGIGSAGGATELVTANLAQKERDGLQVHSIVAAMAAWLLTNASDSDIADAERVGTLRSLAAEWLQPLVSVRDLWDASNTARTAWHVLEPISAAWTETDKKTAYLSLMAMARLPMRHKPAGLTGPDLTNLLATAVAWAQRAQSIYDGGSRSEVLDRGRALAMEGLLRMSLAQRASDPREGERQARNGQGLLERSLELRSPWLVGTDSPEDRDELERAYFNYGRGFITLAKVLTTAGNHRESLDALDRAEEVYTRIGNMRRAHVDDDVDGEGQEKLASCLRGEAIVAFTRVTHQQQGALQDRRDWLKHAAQRLSQAMELTCMVVAGGAENATPDMCKDVALAIKIDVVKQVLHVGPSGAVGALVASSMQEVEDTAVPWRPSTASQMVDAGEGFARLRISSEREGHGIRAEQVAHELITDDVPALRRTLGWA